MGLFNKKTEVKPNTGALGFSEFSCYYLFGFVNSNPNFSLRDQHVANALFEKIIGNKAGVLIGNSLHPYSIIDRDRMNIWQFAYSYILHNAPKTLENLDSDEIMLIDLSSRFKEILLWEDTRLLYEENPIFVKVVPFIIPFLVKDTRRDLLFDKRIASEMLEKQHAHDYLNEINTILKKFMPETVFTLGLDEFVEGKETRIIDKFINAKSIIDRG